MIFFIFCLLEEFIKKLSKAELILSRDRIRHHTKTFAIFVIVFTSLSRNISPSPSIQCHPRVQGNVEWTPMLSSCILLPGLYLTAVFKCRCLKRDFSTHTCSCTAVLAVKRRVSVTHFFP